MRLFHSCACVRAGQAPLVVEDGWGNLDNSQAGENGEQVASWATKTAAMMPNSSAPRAGWGELPPAVRPDGWGELQQVRSVLANICVYARVSRDVTCYAVSCTCATADSKTICVG